MDPILILLFLMAIKFEVSNAIALNCTYDFRSYNSTGRHYTCYASPIFDDKGNEAVTAVYGDHLDGYNNARVTALYVLRNRIGFFPTNIEAFFPNTIVFFFSFNSISVVNNHHLIPFPNMEYLTLQDNSITSLDSNVFAGLSNMKYVDFQRNNITRVGHDFLRPLQGANIYFNHNPCIDMKASTDCEFGILRFNLMLKCPLTVATTLDDHTGLLEDLQEKNLQFESRLAVLEALVDVKVGK